MCCPSTGNEFYDSMGPARGRGNGNGKPVPPSISDADAFPALTTVLTVLPGGAPRGAKLGRVNLFYNRGRLTACVSVPGKGVCAFYSADGFADVIVRLESALQAHKLEWQEDVK